MKPIYTIAAVGAFILASVGSGLLFRVAAQYAGRPMIVYFILGNCVGLVISISLTLALRGTHPNLIYAVCLGGAFCALQMASTLLFREPLSLVQWGGVAFVAIGLVLLTFK
jgi:multidrug transporter EmrE-like cation transporter